MGKTERYKLVEEISNRLNEPQKVKGSKIYFCRKESLLVACVIISRADKMSYKDIAKKYMITERKVRWILTGD